VPDLVVEIGQRCNIHPTAVVGGEGFGYIHDGEGWQHRVHNFGVTIGDYVDIGAYTVIHRGRWRDTQVGNGTKIDAQVFLAHNVVVGAECLLVAGAALAGSVTLGDEVIVGINASVVVGVTIGDRAIIGAGSVVTKDVPANQVWAGAPARYLRDRLEGETL
jgi:UDP-3-O-[3-hydroxymyristoyl] glucosamine N-acyltransferase